jgi:hypothetical protein
MRQYRSIRFMPAPPDDGGRGEYSYSDKALWLPLPHGPDEGCLACSDLRIASEHVPLDPNPELSRIARLMLARAEAFDPDETVRPVRPMRWAYIRGGHLRPTLTASAGVGALLGVVLALLVTL